MEKKGSGAIRIERFSQKTAELEDRLDFIRENLGPENVFLENRILRKALYKEFQELAEIIADLSAMLVKDQDKTVSDDYSNLEAAATLLGLAGSALDGLKRINGLRNVLVHEYNGVIDHQAYDSIGASLLHAKDFLSVIKKWPKTSKKK